MFIHPSKKIFTLILFSLFFLMSRVYAESMGASYQIAKISQKLVKYDEAGRQGNGLGYQFDYFDKFYQKRILPASQMGELYIVEWRASGVPSSGEKLIFSFEYRASDISDIKKKDIEVFVNQNDFYETPIEHIGDEFANEGEIETWKLTILRDGIPMDIRQSNFWID